MATKTQLLSYVVHIHMPGYMPSAADFLTSYCKANPVMAVSLADGIFIDKLGAKPGIVVTLVNNPNSWITLFSDVWNNAVTLAAALAVQQAAKSYTVVASDKTLYVGP